MRFRVLGPMRVWDGEAWREIRAAQQCVVLAVLLATAGRVVTTDRLIEEIWGERPPRAAVRTVQGYVHRLRRVFGDGLLVTRGSGYELAVADGDLDADVFASLVAAGRRDAGEGRPESAAARLEEALALWRGEAFADVPAGPTVTAEAARWEEARRSALEEHLAALLELGRYSTVAAEALRLTAENPLRERLWAQLMTALHRCGRRGDALAAYQRAREVMVTELGLEPGRPLQELHRAIVAAEAPPAYPHDPRQTAVGEAVSLGAVVPAQLPAAVAAFTGRRAELERLDTLLGGGGGGEGGGERTVISTIVGPAGVGKTALAVHWAHRVRDRFADGQLYLNLRGYGGGTPLRPIDALACLLLALGVQADQVPVDVEQAAALYRSLLAGRRTLVLLDDANHPDQVRPLLPASPGCLALITSRDQLRGLVARDGAVGMTLDALDPSEARALLARLCGPQRVAAEPGATAELAHLCGHIPLALRIVAANLAMRSHTSIGDYATGLAAGDRLSGLEVTGDPHTGMRAAFDHSYATLTVDARRMFRLLGLVPGPDLAVPAGAALAGTDPASARRLLDQLTAAHLVDEPTIGRYGLHDLLRLYAGSLAGTADSPADRHAALDRLYRHYQATLDAAADRLYPNVLRLPAPTEAAALEEAAAPEGAAAPDGAAFDDQAQALAWLDAERRNLIAAIHHAAATGSRPVAWRLADALRGYLQHRMHRVDWADVAGVAMAAAEAEADPRARAAAETSLAKLAWVRGRYRQAVEHNRRYLVLAREAGWVEGEWSALDSLALVHWSLGRLKEAARYHAQASAMQDATAPEPDKLANRLGCRGLVCLGLGQLRESADYHGQAVALSRATGNLSGEATTLAGLGEALHALGRLDAALATATDALARQREVGDRHVEAYTLRVLAAVHRDAGRYPEALDLAYAASGVARDIGEPRLAAHAEAAVASIQAQAGDAQSAIDGYQRALDLSRRVHDRYCETEVLGGLAAAHFHAGAHGRATEFAEAALTAARRHEYRLLEGHNLTTLAAVRLGRQDPQQAVDLAVEAVAVHAGTGHRIGQARAHVVAARAMHRAGHVAQADVHDARATELFDRAAAPATEHTRAVLGLHVEPVARP